MTLAPSHSQHDWRYTAKGIAFMVFAFMVFAGWSHTCLSEPSSLQEQTELRSAKIYVAPSYFRLTSDNKILTGLGIGGGVSYGVSSAVSIGVGLRQGYSSRVGGNSAVLFYATDINAEFALTGGLLGQRHTVLLDGKEVVESSSGLPSGFRLTTGFTQYSMNTAFAAVPFSGLSGGFSYEWPVLDAVSLSPSLRIDRISNGRNVFLPLEGALKISYFL